MAINVTNKAAEALVRQFAKIEGVSLTEAITTAVREALARRRRETVQQTAARLRAEFGVELTASSRQPLPRAAYDEICGDPDVR